MSCTSYSRCCWQTPILHRRSTAISWRRWKTSRERASAEGERASAAAKRALLQKEGALAAAKAKVVALEAELSRGRDEGAVREAEAARREGRARREAEAEAAAAAAERGKSESLRALLQQLAGAIEAKGSLDEASRLEELSTSLLNLSAAELGLAPHAAAEQSE